jgi:hypothetical protein
MTTVNNKRVFKVMVDGKELEMAVVRPNHKVNQHAQLIYNRAFREAVVPEDGSKGALVEAKIDDVMREQKLWDDYKQKKFEETQKRLFDNEKKLAKGGIKLTEGKELAIQMRRDRASLRSLLADRNSLQQNTAESLAEQARFNYFVAACTVYNDKDLTGKDSSGKLYFKDVDDYLGRENDPVVLAAAQNFGSLYYNLDDKFLEKLPENAFLKKYKFCGEDLHLIDAKGRKIDAEGRLVDEQGRLINEDGHLIDTEGNLLNDDGTYKVEFQKFLDDNGNPVD